MGLAFTTSLMSPARHNPTHTIMSPTERGKAWMQMRHPKPDWETFKRMLPVFDNNPKIVLAKWLKKVSK